VNTKNKSEQPSQEKKKKEPFIVRKIEVKEIPDESGEVKESTIIKISFDGILMHLSVPAAMRLQRHLSEVLDN